MHKAKIHIALLIALVFAGGTHAQTQETPEAVVRNFYKWYLTELGAEPERMVAVVGPCIGPNSYEVGLEYLDRFVADDADNARLFKPGATDEKRLFDLPAYVLKRLAQAGVRRSEWIGYDTCADPQFFSNRRALHLGEPDYGRLLSAIMLD